MTQSANQPASNAMASFYRPIERELADMTSLLKERLRHLDPLFDAYLEYSFQLGGKRLRPALTLLCGKAAGKIERRHFYIGAALEMIHTGSLVHDDVLDGASFRRQLQTVNAKWDSQRAVLIGDMLITRAFELVCDCEDFKVFRKISQCCQATVEGELYQTESVGNFALSVDDYRRIVGGKTASLIECSAALGAYLGGASEADLDVYGALGRSLGVAFQIVDDVLDLVGDEDVVGKTLGTDLENQKETLPVIFYLQNASRQEKDVLLKRLGGGVRADERADIAALLKGAGAIDAALAEAKRLVDAAVARLAELRKRAEGEGRTESLAAFDSLADLARFVVKRDK